MPLMSEKIVFIALLTCKLQGHCGPIIPQVFLFVSRFDLQVAWPGYRDVAVENKRFPLEMYEHPSEVISLVKSQDF